MRPHLNLLTSLMLGSVSIFSQPNEVPKEAQLFFWQRPLYSPFLRQNIPQRANQREGQLETDGNLISLFSIRNRLGRQGTDRNSSENNGEWKHWDLLFTS
jgi:hypothetical protein